MAKEFPTELYNKYSPRALKLCDAETPVVCYCGRLATGLHTMSCRKFAAKVKSKAMQIAKAAGEVW